MAEKRERAKYPLRWMWSDGESMLWLGPTHETQDKAMSWLKQAGNATEGYKGKYMLVRVVCENVRLHTETVVKATLEFGDE